MSEIAELAIVVADRHGTIREWGAAAARIFGHSREDAIGQSLDLIIPESHRPLHWPAFHRAIAEGRTKYDGELFVDPIVHADGSVRRHRGRLYMLRSPDGSVTGVMTLWEPESPA